MRHRAEFSAFFYLCCACGGYLSSLSSCLTMNGLIIIEGMGKYLRTLNGGLIKA